MIYINLFKKNNDKSKIGNNMTKDTKKTDTNKTENLLMSLKANEKAKKVLFLATNLSNNLSKLVPKMGISVDEIITEIDKRQDIKIKGQIDFNFLKSHLYTLASYDKAKKDRAFEMAVVRGVKLGIKMNSEPKIFKVENDEILIMSKVAVPFKTEQLKGIKGGLKKIANTDEDLVAVNTSIIDNIWASTMAVKTRKPSTKDTARNFKEISNEFLTELNKVYNLANKKDHAKLLSMIDEKVIENLGNMKALLEDNSIRTEWTKANDLMANDVSGNLKQA
jgi:hypothetical protein|tara:strand:+ start:143 stop:976 length:834 start_codon:yes stop_codon:yes gene_type:complete